MKIYVYIYTQLSRGLLIVRQKKIYQSISHLMRKPRVVAANRKNFEQIFRGFSLETRIVCRDEGARARERKCGLASPLWPQSFVCSTAARRQSIFYLRSCFDRASGATISATFMRLKLIMISADLNKYKLWSLYLAILLFFL